MYTYSGEASIAPIDPHGRPIARVPEFDKSDRESRPFVAPPAMGGQYLDERLDIKSRRETLKTLKSAGLKIPKGITAAFELYDRLDSYNVGAPVPQVVGMAPDEAAEALDEFVAAKAREKVAADAKGLLVAQAAQGVSAAFRDAVDEVLSQIGPEFDAAAQEFETAYPKVHGLRNVTEAAAADRTGDTVKAWWTAVDAAKRLNALVDLVLVCYKQVHKTALRHSDNVDRIACLGADFSEAPAILAVAHMPEHLRKGQVSEDLPFGLWAPSVDTGARLSLPESGSDLSERMETFRAERDVQAVARYKF